MSEIPLLDWSANARDVGMVEAEFAETLTGSKYSEALYAAICHVARRQCTVHIDDVLRHYRTRPSHPNAAAAPWVRAKKDGTLLGEIGRRKCESDPTKRAHIYPVYASGLFHGRKSA
jgi:hypothetical protein